MLPNKLTPTKIGKIVDASFDKFDHMRKARLRYLAQYCGRFYARNKGGEQEDRKASPLNMIYNAVNTLVPNLVFRDPKFKVRTEVLAYRGYADTLELAVNTLAKTLKLRRELRKAIIDSLFMAGFMKTGIATSGQYMNLADQCIAIGEPFAEHVDSDDIILDPMARDWEEQMIVGNKFRVLRQDLLDSNLYDPDVINNLHAADDFKGTNRAADFSGSRQEETREMMDFVDLAEIYIPRDKRVITIPYVKGEHPEIILRDVDYSGPDSGPYHMLGYAEVPDNILPLPPVSLWYDLHILGNRMARKIARQADRLKRVLAYDGTAVEDAQAIVESDDGEAIRVQNLAGIKEVNFGGTTEDAYSFMQWVETKFSGMANSMDMLSGQKTDANTATQSEILQTNASVRLSDLQNIVYDFTAEVGTDMVFFLHTDPLIELPLIRRTQGIDEQVVYTPEMRKGDFVNYLLAVQPMSMAKPDPNRKVQHMLQFASNVIPAAAQAAQILGPAFKLGPYLERIAREIDLEEMDEFIDMPTYHQWIMQQMASKVDPGKASGYAVQPGMVMPGQVPIQVGNPNPGTMGQAPQNVTPTTEDAAAAQVVAGQLQQRFPSAAAGQRAAAMNLRGGAATPGGY